MFCSFCFLLSRIYIWPLTFSDWSGPRGVLQVKAKQAGMWKVSLIQKYHTSLTEARKKIHLVLVTSLDLRGVGSIIYPLVIH